MFGCDCITIQHKRKCGKPVKFECKKCRDRLCGGCAKNHHAHSGDLVKLEEKNGSVR